MSGIREQGGRLRRYLGSDADIAVIGIFLILLLTALHAAGYFFAPLLSAVFVGLLASPVAERLERLGLAPGLAAAMLLVATLAGLFTIMYGLILPLGEWIERAPRLWWKFRQLQASLEEPFRSIGDLRDGLRSVVGGEEATIVVKEAGESDVRQFVSAAPSIVGQVMVFIGAYYFFLSGRRELKRSAARLFSRRAEQARTLRLIRRIENSVTRYLAAISLINLCFGVAVTAVLALFGMPQPWLWGGMAFALNFVPYLGPALMAMTIFAAGLIALPTPLMAAAAAGAFVMLNVMEGQFVTPSIIGRASTLNPFIVFCALAFGLWFWGAIGAFLAAPVTLVLHDVAREMTKARLRAADREERAARAPAVPPPRAPRA